MAKNQDSEILFNTAIDTSGLEKGAKKTVDTVKDTAKKLDKYDLSVDVDLNAENTKASGEEIEESVKRTANKANKSLDEIRKTSVQRLQQNIKDLQAFLKHLELAGKGFGFDNYDRAFRKLEGYKQELKEYKKELVGVGIYDNPFQDGTVASELYEARAELDKVINEGSGLGEENYDRAYKRLKEAEQAVKDYKKALTAVQTTEESKIQTTNEYALAIQSAKEKVKSLEAAGKYLGDTEYDEAIVELHQAEQAVKDYKKALTSTKPAVEQQKVEIQELEEEVEDFAEEEEVATRKTRDFSKVASRFGRIARSVSGGLGKLGGAIGSIVTNGFDRIGNRNTDASLGNSVKTIARYVFGIESLFFLANKIRDFGAQGLSNLAKESDTTRAHLEGLKGALTTLQNAFASAFGPVLSIAAPALTSLANLAARAATYVGMLIAALTGQKTFKKAVAIQGDLSDELDKTAGSASDAADAMKDYLSPIDEINKLGAQASGGSSGSGAGGVAGSLGNMFEEVPIESSVANLAQKLRDYVESEDWEGLGTYLADKLNAGIEKVYDVISWQKVGPKVTKFTKSFTTTFNSFVRKLNAEKLGNTIGAGIDTAVRTINGFVDSIEWTLLGDKFGQGVKGILDEVDGKEVGRLINAKFRIAIGFLRGAVGSLPWGQIGTELGEIVNGFFEDIDPQDIADIINGLVDGAIDLVVNFITTTNWGNVLDSIIGIFEGLSTNAKIAIVFGALITLLTGAFGHILGSNVIIGAIAAAGAFVVAKLGEKLLEKLPELKEDIVNGLKNVGTWISDAIKGKGKNEIFDTLFSKTNIDKTIKFKATTTSAFDKAVKAYGETRSKTAKLTTKVSNYQTLLDAHKVWKEIRDKKIKVTLSYVSDSTGMSGKIMRAVGLATGGILKNGRWQPIEGYASGGYPSSARLFYANENGMPELVGRIGSSTAVLNNGQIVASVAAGVYRAVAAAFGQLHSYFSIMSNSMSKLPEIMERFNRMFPQVNVPLPAVARGAVVPPQAYYNQKDIKTLTDSIDALNRKIQSLESSLRGSGNNRGNDYRFTAYVGRRVLFDEVIAEAKLQQQITNNNPFDLR